MKKALHCRAFSFRARPLSVHCYDHRLHPPIGSANFLNILSCSLVGIEAFSSLSGIGLTLLISDGLKVT